MADQPRVSTNVEVLTNGCCAEQVVPLRIRTDTLEAIGPPLHPPFLNDFAIDPAVISRKARDFKFAKEKESISSLSCTYNFLYASCFFIGMNAHFMIRRCSCIILYAGYVVEKFTSVNVCIIYRYIIQL